MTFTTKFTFDPSAVSIGFEIYPKDIYEAILKEPKTFYKEGVGDKETRGGIAFPMTIEEGEFKGKPYSLVSNFGDDWGPKQAKQLLAAALGFDTRNKKGEKEFEEACVANGWDLTVDLESGYLGEGWTQMKGSRVMVDLDIRTYVDAAGETKDSQQFKAAFPG